MSRHSSKSAPAKQEHPRIQYLRRSYYEWLATGDGKLPPVPAGFFGCLDNAQIFFLHRLMSRAWDNISLLTSNRPVGGWNADRLESEWVRVYRADYSITHVPPYKVTLDYPATLKSLEDKGYILYRSGGGKRIWHEVKITAFLWQVFLDEQEAKR